MSRATRITVAQVVLCLLLLALVFAKPVAAAISSSEPGAHWVQVIQCPPAPAPQAALQCPTIDAEAFGRQLDTLTSFYETVITLLVLLLTLIAGLSFVTIRWLSQREVEKIAMDVVGGADFQAKVAAIVAKQIETQGGDIYDTLEALQRYVEDLDDIVGKRKNDAGGSSASGESSGPSPGAPSHESPQAAAVDPMPVSPRGGSTEPFTDQAATQAQNSTVEPQSGQNQNPDIDREGEHGDRET